MEIKNTFGVVENLFAKNLANKTGAPTQPPPPQKAPTGTAVDVVGSPTKAALKFGTGSRLISEDIQKTENGFRRTQEFETVKGQKFTRVEEVTSDEDRTKRLVVQQNESGSTTILENILDRQDDGTFRQTQRFTNESGETKTNIEFGVTASNTNQVLGVPPSPDNKSPQPFEQLRGTQYDVVT